MPALEVPRTSLMPPCPVVPAWAIWWALDSTAIRCQGWQRRRARFALVAASHEGVVDVGRQIGDDVREDTSFLQSFRLRRSDSRLCGRAIALTIATL